MRRNTHYHASSHAHSTGKRGRILTRLHKSPFPPHAHTCHAPMSRTRPLRQVQLCSHRGTAGGRRGYFWLWRPDWIKARLIPVEFVSFFQATLNPNQIIQPSLGQHQHHHPPSIHGTVERMYTSQPLSYLFPPHDLCVSRPLSPQLTSPLPLWLMRGKLIDSDRP